MNKLGELRRASKEFFVLISQMKKKIKTRSVVEGRKKKDKNFPSFWRQQQQQHNVHECFQSEGEESLPFLSSP